MDLDKLINMMDQEWVKNLQAELESVLSPIEFIKGMAYAYITALNNLRKNMTKKELLKYGTKLDNIKTTVIKYYHS